MSGRSIGIVGVVLFLNACSYTSPTATGSSSTEGAGGGGANGGSSNGGSAGSGAAGGDGGKGMGGSGGSGGGGTMFLPCPPFFKPNSSVIEVDPSQAGSLHTIVGTAPSGSAIVLAKGTYAISNPLRFLRPDITLRSATDNADDVVIDGKYQVGETIVIIDSNITIAHVTITHAINHLIRIHPSAQGNAVNNTLLYGLRLIDGGQQLIKVNPGGTPVGYVDEGRLECSVLELTDTGRLYASSGCSMGGIVVQSGWNWQIRNNMFRGIYCNAALGEHAIHALGGSRDTLVENNLIIDCGLGIGFGAANSGQRTYSDSPHQDSTLAHYDGIIRNNVVYGDITHFDTGIEIAIAKQPRVYHNTVVKGPNVTTFYSGIDYRYSQTFAVIQNNLTTRISDREGATGTVDTNLQDVPLDYFLNPSAWDFHLSSMAILAIDKGVPVDAPGIDIDGQQHMLGIGPDLGADETNP